MGITYGNGASDAVRTRLPGVANTVAAGESARDIDDRFGALPPLQLVEVNGQTYAEPMFVRMPNKPKIVLVCTQLAQDNGISTINVGANCEFVWRGDGITVRNIDGLSPTINAGTLYNFVFLGVG